MAIQPYEMVISVLSFLRGVKYTNPLPAISSMPINKKVMSVWAMKALPHSAAPRYLVPMMRVANCVSTLTALAAPVPSIFLNIPSSHFESAKIQKKGIVSGLKYYLAYAIMPKILRYHYYEKSVDDFDMPYTAVRFGPAVDCVS